MMRRFRLIVYLLIRSINTGLLIPVQFQITSRNLLKGKKTENKRQIFDF
ncbi:unnamed protein product [Oikopleura dioica]|uniref:Uncharacterized protein n=1 Tax=Oikopleura dioica TaxID=34765 RepID=E4Y137_OIKDI|nr:unnamed protein product [Oikopleura dioica]